MFDDFRNKEVKKEWVRGKAFHQVIWQKFKRDTAMASALRKDLQWQFQLENLKHRTPMLSTLTMGNHFIQIMASHSTDHLRMDHLKMDQISIDQTTIDLETSPNVRHRTTLITGQDSMDLRMVQTSTDRNRHLAISLNDLLQTIPTTDQVSTDRHRTDPTSTDQAILINVHHQIILIMAIALDFFKAEIVHRK
jgi:hypothetical protein